MAGVSRVVFGGRTLVDLTSDTVAAGSMLAGATAHAADGSEVSGELVLGIRMATDAEGDVRPVWAGEVS